MDEEKKELLKELKILKENLDKGYGISDIFKKYVVSGNEKFVVFLKNTTHLGIMKPVIEKWFLDAGFTVRLYEVHSKNVDRDKEFQAFKKDTEDGIKLCLSVNMLAEGIHGDIDGVIMLRETISANMYFQMIGRAFACGKKTIPLIIDLVANSQFISNATNLSFPNELRGEIEKRKKECEKEGKEYDPGFDVDEFIIMDEFMDVISGFKAIEGRLQGSWDLYIKALKQYKEREGDCDVIDKHIEIMDGMKVRLGEWCNRIIGIKNGNNRGLITREREKQLNQLGFIWDVYKYRFNNNIKSVAEYLKMYGKYPSNKSKDVHIQKLGRFLNMEKMKMRNEKEKYPEWKKEIIENYIPDFSSETRHNKSLNEFLCYVKLYKERYGHTNIKKNDIIDSFNIGARMNTVKNMYKSGTLLEEEINLLNNLGICIGSKYEKEYCKKIELVKQAVKQGVFISESNKCYKGVNLYNWINNHKKRFSNEEMEIINQVMPPCSQNVPVRISDIKNHICKEYISISEAGRALHNEFNAVDSDTKGIKAIYNRLTGKIRNSIYKERFQFEYVDDKTAHKLPTSNDKAS